MAGSLQVEVVSAAASVWSGEADFVSARTVEGEIGIMANHEPVLAILAPGKVKIRQGGTEVQIDAKDGFLSVEHNTVRVVAFSAELEAVAGATPTDR